MLDWLQDLLWTVLEKIGMDRVVIRKFEVKRVN